jgi:PHD/YefM family antitoxin component YafN of YafNO toxin-antitoxin module
MVEISSAAKDMYGTDKIGWITISTDEYNSMVRTIEVLSDKDLMAQIEEGKKDNAKIMDFEELARELGV